MLTNITCSEIHRESGRGGEEWCTFCMYNKIKMCGRVRVHKWLLVGAYENLLILELVSIHCQHFSLPKFLFFELFYSIKQDNEYMYRNSNFFHQLFTRDFIINTDPTIIPGFFIHWRETTTYKFLHANIFIVNTKPFYIKYTLNTSTISTCYLFYGFLKGAGAQPSTGWRNARTITFRNVPHLYMLLLTLYQQIKGT